MRPRELATNHPASHADLGAAHPAPRPTAATPLLKHGPAPRRILLIKPSSLGDVVHALPVLAALRERYPAAHIAWLIATPFAPLLANHPDLDELILFDRRHYGRMHRSFAAWRAFWRFIADLRARRFDLILDLQGLLRSSLIALLANTPRRVGPAFAREGARWFYTHQLAPTDNPTHAVDRNVALTRALLGPAAALAPPRFNLALTPAEHAAAATLLRDHKISAARYIAVIPGARWASKQWPVTHYADLCDRLTAARHLPLVLLGSPDERPLCEQIVRTCHHPPANLAGATSLRTLAAVLDRAALVVCNDSGPMHIAAALNTPTLALFGPTDPRRTGPYSESAEVLQQPLECVPCYRRLCPLHHHDCLQTLSPAHVASAAANLHPPTHAPDDHPPSTAAIRR